MKRMMAAVMLVCLLSIQGCQREQENQESVQAVSENFSDNEWHPAAGGQEKKEAEEDCQEILENIRPIFENSERGLASNSVITDETAEEMLDKMEESGCAAYFSRICNGVRNYRQMEKFLKQSRKGEKGEILLYELCEDGGIGRNKFVFDGQEMMVIYTRTTWNDDSPVLHETESYTVKEWEYTKKGWFCYEFCVPEPPELSERINADRMVRVKPLKQQYLETASRYLYPVGYQKNNLICSNWDSEHLEDLDYRGLYECFYFMKNQEQCRASQYPDGIPGEEFESLLQEYLPVTTEQIRRYVEFDEKKQVYIWKGMGGRDYTPTAFGASIPEITDMKENEDGTTAITVDAVCRRTGNDCVITHVLTVRFDGAGRVKYLGNQVLGDGLEQIPAYQYRR